ncbi:hypothetical protein [Flavobacterium sp. SM2513]|uniref:hypothetical protein n=1 Tax=Flavobacterium sp. SM2513 TaxID=3424766 RepID=UPI003D7F310D
MSRTSRVFGKDFKAKVVLKALKEKETLELLPTQISMWKAEPVKNISAVFNQGKEAAKKKRFQPKSFLQELVN